MAFPFPGAAPLAPSAGSLHQGRCRVSGFQELETPTAVGGGGGHHSTAGP
jgi:hypothetical protein